MCPNAPVAASCSVAFTLSELVLLLRGLLHRGAGCPRVREASSEVRHEGMSLQRYPPQRLLQQAQERAYEFVRPDSHLQGGFGMKEMSMMRRKYLERHAAKGEVWAKLALKEELEDVRDYREGADTKWFKVRIEYDKLTSWGLVQTRKWVSEWITVEMGDGFPSRPTLGVNPNGLVTLEEALQGKGWAAWVQKLEKAAENLGKVSGFNHRPRLYTLSVQEVCGPYATKAEAEAALPNSQEIWNRQRDAARPAGGAGEDL